MMVDKYQVQCGNVIQRVSILFGVDCVVIVKGYVQQFEEIIVSGVCYYWVVVYDFYYDFFYILF